MVGLGMKTGGWTWRCSFSLSWTAMWVGWLRVGVWRCDIHRHVVGGEVFLWVWRVGLNVVYLAFFGLVFLITRFEGRGGR